MFTRSLQRQAIRFNSTVAKSAPRALSNAYIGKLESRWTTLPKEDQQTIIEELKSRMELPWQELSPAEKRLLTTFPLENGDQEDRYMLQEKNHKFFGSSLVVSLDQSLCLLVSRCWLNQLQHLWAENGKRSRTSTWSQRTPTHSLVTHKFNKLYFQIGKSFSMGLYLCH